jgi:hypothetical protein
MADWHIRRWIGGLLLLALLSLVVLGLGRRAPPFREVSDGAVLEIYTLEALKGSLRVGPYSRFGWHHPGPLYFYVQAPWYWLSGHHTLGMQAGALLVNLAAVAMILALAARYASPSTAMAVALAIVVFVYRTGDLIVSVWNPHVVILPLVAFVVVAAALGATGSRAILLSAVILGSFLVQTHVAMGPAVAVPGVTAMTAQWRAVRAAWRPAAALALVLWLPSLVEQATRTPGNITRLTAFFIGDRSPRQSFETAAAAWSTSLTSAFGEPFVVAMGLDLHLEGTGPVVWALGQVLALGVALLLGMRRGNGFGAWIAATCALTSLIAFAATTQIRGRIVDHEVFWMSALGLLNAAVIAGALVPFRMPRGAIVSAVCAASFIAVIGRGGVGIRHALERSRTIEDHSVDVLTDAIHRALRDGGVRRPLFHIEHPIWPVAAGALLQLHKARIPFAVDDRWVSMFGEAFEANGQEDAKLTITGSIRMPRLLN